MGSMTRREFAKLTGAAGLGAMIPFANSTPARAAAVAPYDGPLFILINAMGGWDPTSICDPKGRANEMSDAPVNMYFTDDIQEAGNIQYAPVAGLETFFEAYYPDLLVINGVDTETNGHDSGRRNMWSGQLAEGYPTLGAAVAAAHGSDLALSFITNGGYDHTAGLVAPTRMGNTDVVTRLAFPNRVNPSAGDETYHLPSTYARIEKMRQERLAKRMEMPQLPRVRHAMGMLYGAHGSENQLQKLTEFLPEVLDNSGNPLRRQAEVAIASYKAGLTISANLTYGGFDTHGNHDNNHYPRLAAMMDGVGYIMEEADRQGVADKVIIVVGSDFGRTPWYNDGNGKDHWSITSYMLMGTGIEGNRVIGATDGGHVPLTVNADTLELDPNGIRITPAHVQRSLRKLAGVYGTEVDGLFPLDVEDLPLFTAG
jgi:hypothetical protein